MRVLKWDVPVDDHAHSIGGGPVVHVGNQGGHGTVQVWTEEASEGSPVARLVQVYGTGHPIPNQATHLGSTLAGPFVWHLYAVGAP